MTWAEFQIRAYAHQRINEREELLFREVAWSSYVGGSLMLKKIPHKDKFWKIGNSGVASNDNMTEAVKRAQEEYFKKKKELDG